MRAKTAHLPVRRAIARDRKADPGNGSGVVMSFGAPQCRSMTDTSLSPDLQRVQEHLRALALGYPEVQEDFPWGHSAFKVRGKAFVFLAAEDEWLKLSVKLPQSHPFALDQPFTEPTGYGLGRAGWVSARFAAGDDIPMDLLTAWVAESFRAIAPKKLLASLS